MHIEGSLFFLQQKKNDLFLLNATNSIEHGIFSPELLGPVKTDSGVIPHWYGLVSEVCFGWCEYSNQTWMQVKTTGLRPP